MATARGEATDGPVHWTSHFHLLSHLCKPHHQLDKQSASCASDKNRLTFIQSDGDGCCCAGWTYQGFLVVVSLGVDTNNHLDFALSVKVVLEQMCHFRVSVGNHLWEKTYINGIVHQEIWWQCSALVIHTLFVPHSWFSRSISMHVRRFSKDWLMLPAR